MTSVICWGATGHAAVLREALSYAGHGLALLVDHRELVSPFPGVPCVHGEAGLAAWEATLDPDARFGSVLAIGGAHGGDRLALQRMLEARGYAVVDIIHPRAFVAGDAQIGRGCQILAMAAVCTRSQLGESVIVNTRASVDHDCELGDGVHIGPGATLAGEVVVGTRAFIGAGSTILPRIQIGADAVVGAGAVVTRDVAPGSTVVGVPAKVRSLPR